ncbi:hypothetical protein D9M72_632430 [compost metagenome]
MLLDALAIFPPAYGELTLDVKDVARAVVVSLLGGIIVQFNHQALSMGLTLVIVEGLTEGATRDLQGSQVGTMRKGLRIADHHAGDRGFIFVQVVKIGHLS